MITAASEKKLYVNCATIREPGPYLMIEPPDLNDMSTFSPSA